MWSLRDFAGCFLVQTIWEKHLILPGIISGRNPKNLWTVTISITFHDYIFTSISTIFNNKCINIYCITYIYIKNVFFLKSTNNSSIAVPSHSFHAYVHDKGGRNRHLGGCTEVAAVILGTSGFFFLSYQPQSYIFQVERTRPFRSDFKIISNIIKPTQLWTPQKALEKQSPLKFAPVLDGPNATYPVGQHPWHRAVHTLLIAGTAGTFTLPRWKILLLIDLHIPHWAYWEI